MREKSLVPMCSEISGNWRDISKGILQSSISRFESCHPSQPLSSLWTVSAFRIISRDFRRLARDQSVSAGKSAFFSRFGISCARVSSREFLISGFCCLRLGSTALRPVRLHRLYHTKEEHEWVRADSSSAPATLPLAQRPTLN